MAADLTFPLPCIVCGYEPEPVDHDRHEDNNQPYGATAFTSHGHYGSTVFDPMDGQYLEINICDTCLRRGATSSRVVLSRDHRPVLTEYPDDDGHVWTNMYVGHDRVNRPFVRWTGNEEQDPERQEDVRRVSVDEWEQRADLGPNLDWHDGERAVAASNLRRQERIDYERRTADEHAAD
jgi:hypothetical protein